VRVARGALADIDTGFPAARLHDASVCLSELVTNAVQHAAAGGDLELTVEFDDRRLRVEVANPGGGFRPDPPSAGDERGWGLYIVDHLADRWGVEPGTRTVVWFEILHQGGASGRVE
jgi:anti-sigma regulatory factor (Ser/Thr protein kinase)